MRVSVCFINEGGVLRNMANVVKILPRVLSNGLGREKQKPGERGALN